MVNLTMPSNPADLPPPEPSNVPDRKASAFRQILTYLFYLLFVGVILGALWWAQTQGYFAQFGF